MNIEILAGSSDAPEVYVGHACSASILSSHRDCVAACAVAQSTIPRGNDVELIETRSEALVGNYFPEKEKHLSQDEAEANPIS